MFSFTQNNKENPTKDRPIHPKVLNILHHLTEPSPVRLVKDLFQPISGSLAEKKIPIPIDSEICEPKVFAKQSVTLNLKMSSIRSKRLSITNINQ